MKVSRACEGNWPWQIQELILQYKACILGSNPQPLEDCNEVRPYCLKCSIASINARKRPRNSLSSWNQVIQCPPHFET
eukprot:360311-Chlamydomonas_euryale.AAC.6